MKKSLLAVALATACLATPAAAQMKLPNPFAKKPDAAAAATPAPTGDALVAAFLKSHGMVVTAQTTFAEALDLKDALALLQAEQKAMASGPLDKDGMKKSRQHSETATAQMLAALESQPQLSAEAKTKFSRGLVEYLAAVVAARDVLVQAKQFVSSVGSNPMSLVGKAGTAMYVGKEMPGYLKGMGTTTRALFAYAKRNDIKTPANATAQLDDL